jgi:predicted acetyltransferase
MPDVEVIVAAVGQKGVLENLFQLYVHDFSEHWAGTNDGVIGDDGRFEPYRYLDSYWNDENRVPLFIRADGRLAGFALLNRHSQTGQDVDRNMAEFFIARKHRRSGVGTAAVHAILARYRGVWEIAVARRNVAAGAFWRRAVEHHPLVGDLKEIDLTTPSWNGPVLRFRLAEAAPA